MTRSCCSLDLKQQAFRKMAPGLFVGSAKSSPIEAGDSTSGLAVVDLSPVLGGSHYNLHVASNPSVLFHSESESLIGQSTKPSKLIHHSRSYNFLSNFIRRKEQNSLESKEGK